MNFLLPPFDDVKVRRAALLAMNQKDVMEALIGNPEYFEVCGSFFMCGHAARHRCRLGIAGQGQRHGGSQEAARRIQYDGTPIVIMAPGDVVTLKAQPVVAAQALLGL
jgi:peptide/nickel transport system substrate-binding protein